MNYGWQGKERLETLEHTAHTGFERIRSGIWIGAVLVGLAACSPSTQPPITPPAPPPPAVLSMVKLTAKPNPTGLQVGFWEVFNQQAVTLKSMGKRPISRGNFESWIKLETAPGVYSFPTVSPYTVTHRYGEQVLATINISFSSAITPGKETIPSFYTNDIADPTTRAAAKKFLYAYVQYLLKQVGPVLLTIDYEIISNWKLFGADSGRDARAATWGAWYVEAAGVARQAAADLGLSRQLKLQPTVNGNPFAPNNPIAKGAAANRWLVDVIAKSDSLALDTYHTDPNLPVQDPTNTIKIIQFWIENFAGDKEVNITENGFTTITEQDPTITRQQRDMKLTGTEQEQAEYYAALFPRLLAENKPGGLFQNKLRSINLWSIVDNSRADAKDDIYFGLVRLDGTEKPAASVVRSAIKTLETDSFNQPWTLQGAGVDVTASMDAGVDLTYTDGTDFEFVRYTDPKLAAGSLCQLSGSAGNSGSLVVSINGQWVYKEVSSGPFDLDLGSACKPGGENVVDVYATGPRFPFAQRISQLKLKTF
jgi:hypothetical protein